MSAQQSIETFFGAWSETDADARLSAIVASCAANGTYADPRTPDPINGVEALAEYVGMFSANAPGWTAEVVKSDEIAGMTRATVAFGGKGPGEMCANPVLPAIANAVFNAVGVECDSLPITPEKVLRGIRANGGARPQGTPGR